MKQILREMYQSELDPAFDKLHREIGHLENRIKIREEEIDKLNLKLIEAIKVHHGCSDEKNQLELKLGSLRNDNDKLMQNLNSATALLREMGAKDTNLTEISDKTISEKENR